MAFISLFCSSALAISYTKKCPSIRSFIENETIQENLSIKEDKKLFTISYIPKKTKSNDAIFIIPGWSEPILYYDELIYDLKDSGLPIIGYDHPSQGLSYRNLKDSGKTHVLDFDEYLAALKFIYDKKLKKYDNVYVISHSMGSHIATRYVMQYPTAFKKIIMISPLFQINTRFIPSEIANNIVKKMMSLGAGGWYLAPPIILNKFKHSMTLNNGTRSKERFDGRNYWIKKYPSMTSTGPTWHWVNMTMNSNNDLFKNLKSIKLPPTILIQAGDDSVVRNERQTDLCSNSMCRLIKVDKAKHWIHRELDEARTVVLNEISGFFNIK